MEIQLLSEANAWSRLIVANFQQRGPIEDLFRHGETDGISRRHKLGQSKPRKLLAWDFLTSALEMLQPDEVN